MKNARNSQSQRWLYIIIIAIALIAIVLILIINNAKPQDNSGDSGIKYTDSSETDSKQDSSSSKKQDSSTNSTAESKNESNSSSESAPSSSTSPNSTAPSYTPIPQPVEHKCYHEEAGVCWDDLENDAYSAGLYDHEYGYYGASYNEPDNCDAICRDILEDAYEEGWADGM